MGTETVHTFQKQYGDLTLVSVEDKQLSALIPLISVILLAIAAVKYPVCEISADYHLQAVIISTDSMVVARELARDRLDKGLRRGRD